MVLFDFARGMGVGQTAQQFAKAGVTAGLWTPDEVKSWWESLPANQRSKDGETFAAALIERARITRFQADELLTGSSTPLVLGEYVLQARIGAGGMGQVFKARHRRMKRFAAIKLLPTALTQNEAAIKRFEREVEAAAKLSHPNIVQTHDAGVQQGVWYLVMEYVEGQDLSAVVATQSPLPIAVAVDYIRQAAKGLAYAHKSGVVHRDIKPANLLLDKEGTIKILDMGLARFEDPAAAKDGLTESGLVMGTVDYMAPEQAFDVHTADARADIYSLGCTLYRLLTNRNVYVAESLVQKLLSHQNKPVPALATHRPDVPPSLVAIFERMVAKKPEDRYQSMTEVETALANCNQTTAASDASKPAADSKLTSFFRSITGAKAATPAATPAATISLSKEAIALDAPEVLPTVNLSNPLQSTDPVSDRSIQVARENTPSPVSLKRTSLNRNKLWLAAGGAGSLLAVLLGFWLFSKGYEAAPKISGSPAVIAPAPAANNHALVFDGDDVVNIGSAVPLPPDSCTIEAFASIDGFTPSAYLYTPGGLAGLSFDLLDGAKLRMGQVFVAGGHFATAAENVFPLQLGQRYHIAGVSDANGQRVYLDGKLTTISGPLGGQALAQPNGTCQIGALFKGKIEGIKISAKPLYTADFRPPTQFEADTDTFALYRFDEGVGEILKDSSGHNRHGTIVGAKWIDLKAVAPPTPAPFALEFDGVDDHVDIHSHWKYDGGPFTFEAWVVPKTPSPEAYVSTLFSAEHRAGSAGHGLRLIRNLRRISNGNPLNEIHFSCMPDPNVAGFADRLVSGQRTHVAAVYEPGSALWFVNGEPAERRTFHYVWPNQDHSLRTSLGGYNGKDGWWGTMEQVKLSSAARYSDRFTPTPNLTSDNDTIALYRMSEGQGEVLKDSSGHERHGKIIGAKWVRADVSPITAAPVTTAPPLAKAPFNAAEAKSHQQAWADYLGTDLVTTNSVGAKMVLIPPGEFLMGSSDADVALGLKIAAETKLEPPGVQRIQEERPQHLVRITKPFRLGIHEVTIGQFRRFTEQSNYKSQAEEFGGDSYVTSADDLRITPESMKLNWRSPGYEVGENSPVTQVSWYDAIAYCNWLSEQEQLTPSYIRDGANWMLVPQPQGYRLPTEAEWEYACRAGTTTQYSFGDDWKELDKFGWSTTNSGGRPRSVGLLPANPFGVHDMHGNVWEWCHDWYDGKWYEQSPTDDPRGPPLGDWARVDRGGGSDYPAASWRSSSRYGSHAPAHRHWERGFRVALSGDGVKLPTAPAASQPTINSSAAAPPTAKAPFTATEAKAHQQAWAKHLEVETETTGSFGVELVIIPPDRELEVPLYIGKYEVTQEQFESVMGFNPSKFKPTDMDSKGLDTRRFPVEQVNWFDAVEFCNKLSSAEGLPPYYELLVKERNGFSIENADVTPVGGKGYRLPAMEMWKHACFAGSTAIDQFGQLSAPAEYCWYQSNSSNRTHNVGEKKPNAFSLFDTYGNVREWQAEVRIAKDNKIVCSQIGWCWQDSATTIFYHASTQATRSAHIGFRVAREINFGPQENPKIP